MDEKNRDEVSKLLRRGLNHYGLGEVEEAIACWERVWEIDPDNQVARDYLESAHEEMESSDPDDTPPTPPLPSPSELPASSSDPKEESDDLVWKALALYQAGDLRGAKERLEKVSSLEPDRLDVQGYLELVRAQLLRSYEKAVGDQGRRPRLLVDPTDLQSRQLGPVEGYLLSQIDGILTLEELLTLSTVGRFRTLEILSELIRDEIIE